jgi:hypothetical protein
VVVRVVAAAVPVVGDGVTTLASALNQTDGYRAAVEFSQNNVGGFGPDERFGAGIVLGEISIDSGLQVGDRAEYPAADALAGHLGEEVLDGVEPRGRGRGEVERPTRMARQPGPHPRFREGQALGMLWVA